MRVLVLSSVYPSRTRPIFGVFVRERVRHVAMHCEVVVVSPIPWFPFNGWIRGRAVASTPFVEERDGITVYHPRFLCVPGYAKCLDGILYFASLLPFLAWLRRRFPFDVIDSHFTYPDGLAGVLLGRVWGRPTLVTLRGTHDLRQMGYALRKGQVKFAIRAATRVIAVSDSLRRAVADLGVDPAKVRVIPNGVDASRFFPSDRHTRREALGLPEDRTILLAVGGLVEGKGHHRVIRLLPDLLAKRPDLLYVAIGAEVAGDTHGRMIGDLVRRHGVEAHVRIVPPRPHDEIPTWMGAADLFCLATRSEGWCNSLMEALACGLPVVSTRVGGNAEVVREGSDGLLVPFWDAQAFGAAVLQALETPWDRAAISDRARAAGWKRTAELVVEELHRALAPGAAQLNDTREPLVRR